MNVFGGQSKKMLSIGHRVPNPESKKGLMFNLHTFNHILQEIIIIIDYEIGPLSSPRKLSYWVQKG